MVCNAFILSCNPIFLFPFPMKYIFLIFGFLLCTIACSAQFYYNDIVNTAKLNAEYNAVKARGSHVVVLKSFEDDDAPSEGFFCERKFSKDFSTSSMLSKSYITGESVLNASYQGDKIVKAVTETPTTTNTTTYTYDSAGNLSSIQTVTYGNADSASFSELRTYNYEPGGGLVSMARMKNGKKVSAVNFIKDEKGNIVEEVPAAGAEGRKYYYYYDEKSRMTDIVHFNDIAQKLLPDFMFHYDDNGVLSQMISVDETARNYFIWKYSYTQDGLPDIQKCYSKEKRLLGTIQYEYR